MTEKQYGGSTGRGTDKVHKAELSRHANKDMKKTEAPHKKTEGDNSSSEIEGKEASIKAGQIASEAKKYAKSIIKKDMLLLDIADKIESKIAELGAKPAFPAGLSINEIASHDTPAFNDTRKAHGLLKVDFGVHIDGYIADTAFSIDLDNSEENKKLIMAAEKAVLDACRIIGSGVKTREVGSAIEKAIKSLGFTPINNLCGHSVGRYHLHAGVNIPNYDNSQELAVEEGVYAVEPFATTGLGKVKDGKPSGIYRLEKGGAVRDALAREVLDFIYGEYQTLPFCARWIYKKFGSRGLLALKRIEETGMLHSYPQLIEIGSGKVAQVEHTIMVEKNKKTITTL